MSNPTLHHSAVSIYYKSSDGYSTDTDVSSSGGRPVDGLLAGLEELARITALFGFEDEALERFNDARARVAEWKKSRA